MESKYEKRVKELILDSCIMTMKKVGISQEDFVDNIVIEMCQLAEEVEMKLIETEYIKGYRKGLRADKPLMYTKQQVEELLQKQRELSKNAILELVYTVDYAVRSNYTVTDAIYDGFEETKLKIE